MRLRCPECGSEEVRAATEATVYQRASVGADGLVFESYAGDDLELGDDVHLLCSSCATSEEVPEEHERAAMLKRWTKYGALS